MLCADYSACHSAYNHYYYILRPVLVIPNNFQISFKIDCAILRGRICPWSLYLTLRLLLNEVRGLFPNFSVSEGDKDRLPP